MFWIGDKELILIQNSSSLGRMEDNPIYLIILDSSEREREREREREVKMDFMNLRKSS
jgi:hypothetical protein